MQNTKPARQPAPRRSNLLSTTGHASERPTIVSATVPHFVVRSLADRDVIAAKPRVTVLMDPVTRAIVGWSVGFDDDARGA